MKRIIVEIERNSVFVYGATYHVRHILKMLNFRFDRRSKEWVYRGDVEDVDAVENRLSAELRRAGCTPRVSGDPFDAMMLRIVYLCPFR